MADQKITLADRGIFYLSKDIDRESMHETVSFILEQNLRKDKPKSITLIVSSYGGWTDASFAITDAMAGSSIPVNTIGLGMIASSGFMIFIAGKHRTLTPNTGILSHQFSWGTYGKEHELLASMTRIDQLSKRIIEHYKRHTKLSEKKILQHLLPPQDIWLTPEEVKRYGACESICTLQEFECTPTP